MASSIMSSTTVATLNRTTPAQASMVAPYTGLKSSAAFPVTRKPNNDFSSLPSNGGRVQCMLIWPTTGKKKFETLSYLPTLTDQQLAREVDYLIRSGWIPCWNSNYSTDLCTVRITGHQVTMMGGTGPCGSYPCMDAQTLVRL
ncbi:Ribulose-1,5-bisphosphate carboxylase small subunit [Bacillus thuringiensis T01-328]|uniref:Ribulose-1,5-bisphosphate carboxylase small subunit n=2 Tax=Bacillus thuringiensis TaxID=1428 RepID=A0AAN4HB71_BACTU|nr:Ribulose-1,5-bisphosphate carboxylase small subunit [Bacillus thuringiensis T01-328]